MHLTEEEQATLAARARAAGGVSLAAYARAAALGEPAPVAAAVPALNLEQHAALGRVAANLNQIGRHLNRGDILTDRDLLPTLRQLYADVQQVRRLLLGAEAP